MEAAVRFVAVDDVEKLALCRHGLVVLENVNLGTRGKTFAVAGNDDEAVGDGRGAENRCAADGEGFDFVFDDADARVIDAADLRDELSRQWQAQFSVWPVGRSAAEQANRATREE